VATSAAEIISALTKRTFSLIRRYPSFLFFSTIDNQEEICKVKFGFYLPSLR